MKFIITISLFMIPFFTRAQSPGAYLKEGNEYYKKGRLAEAVTAYEKVTDEKYKYIALLNKGTALYKQKKYEDAIKTYRQVSGTKNADALLRSGAYYNTGVVYSNQKKIEESIEEYKNALRLNWKDTKARENLQKALLEKKQSGGGGGSSEEKDQQSQSKMNKSQAEQQLNRLEQKEKNTQDRVAGKKSEYTGSAGKDW